MLPYTIDAHNCVVPIEHKMDEWWEWVSTNLPHHQSFNLKEIRHRTKESFGGIVCRVFDIAGKNSQQSDTRWSYTWDQQTQVVELYFETKNDLLMFKLKL